MKLSALAVTSHGDRSDLQLDAIRGGLNVVFDSSGSATAAAELVANLLYNLRSPLRSTEEGVPTVGGQIDVECRGRKYRLRRSHEGRSRGQIAVSSLDDRPVDRDAAGRLFSQLSPTAARLCAIDFSEPLPIEWLLSEEVASELESVGNGSHRLTQPCAASSREVVSLNASRHDELIDRRDALAKALESRIASERLQSRELDERWQKLDAQYQAEEHKANALREQLQTAQVELAELDARLRYFRLDADEEIPSRAIHWKTALADLDQQIDHQQSLIGQMEKRHADLRGRLADLDSPDESTGTWMVAAQREWLAVSRRVATDLEGEVARLARSSQPHNCVCLDAHPRLRPVAETVHIQLNAFESLLERQERAILAQELRDEAAHLIASIEAVQNSLGCLLERRKVITRHVDLSQRLESYRSNGFLHAFRDDFARLNWSDVDIDSLEQRRAELVGEVARLRDNLATVEPKLDSVREERQALNQRRSELLSIRPIEEAQRELTAAQRAVQHALREAPANDVAGGLSYASELLAQLTDGRLKALRHARANRGLRVVDRTGKTVAIEALSAIVRDQVCLSICLALVSGYGERGVSLPVALEEPFLRMKRRDMAALAAVLEDFGRRGNQAIVFTKIPKAVERFDVTIRDLRANRHNPSAIHGKQGGPVTVSDQDDQSSPPDGVFSQHEESPLRNALQLRVETGSKLAQFGLHTVGQLWDADPDEVARRLNRDDIWPDTVRGWQTQTTLLCFVPDLTLDDARILEGAGIDDPEALATSDETSLFRAIERYLATAGRRYPNRGDRYSRVRAGRWIDGAKRNRARWRRSAPWQRTRRQRGLRSPRHGRKRKASPNLDRSDDRQPAATPDRRVPQAIRFRLSAHDPVVNAPSIGTKTASRLHAIEIETVADLLWADPTDVSARLDVRHVRPDTVELWQRQARLLCQMPEIRGHDAQILVGCDLTEPEAIAQMKPEELLERVSPFCNSKAGERIIRSCKKPDLAEVTDWILWAGQRRSLDAA